MTWIKNSSGEPDAMLSFATIAFIMVTLNLLLATLGEITIAGTTLHFQAMDTSVMSVYLGATLTAYVSRKWTDKHYESAGATNEEAA